MPGSDSRMAASRGSCDDGSSSVDALGSSAESSAGELLHQPAELAARVVELAVDQGEAFGDEPHMGDGGLGRARGELDGRCSQPLT